MGVLIPSFQNPQRKATWNKEFDKTLLNTNTIAMKDYFYLFKHFKIYLGLISLWIQVNSYAQNPGDYRTIGSGNWSSASIWQFFNGTNWVPFSAPVSASPNHILVSAGDSVCIISTDFYRLANAMQVDGVLNILGKFELDTFVVNGVGKFRNNANSHLIFGHKFGMSAIGNIQTAVTIFATNGIYEFKGYEKQITGKRIPNYIKKLIVNNSSLLTDSSGVILSKNIIVQNTLIFLASKIFTSDTSMITMRDSAVAKGYGPGKFVHGPIRFTWANNRLTHKFIPLGKDTIYRPIEISYNHNNSNVNVYQYEMIYQAPPYTALAGGANFSSVSNIRYWKCDRVVNGGSTVNNAIIRLYWGPGDQIVNHTLLKAGRGNTTRTAWDKTQGTPNFLGSNTWGYLETADNNPSDAFDYILGDAPFVNLLPADYLGFETYCNNQTLFVQWLTSNEVNISEYRVEIESEITEFSKSKYINAKNKVSGINEYLVDFDIIGINKSVKIFEIDQNQKETISVYAPSASCLVKNNRTFISPNPITNKLNISFNSRLLNKKLNIKIINSYGKLVWEEELYNLKYLEHNINIPTDLPSGTYFTQITSGEYQDFLKLIKL